MKPKPKAPKKKPSPTEVARAAGCTKALAHRLLARGLTREEIIARVAESKRREADLMELPSIPINGRAAGIPSYAESQAVKEFHLSQLRGIEVDIKRRQLYPLQPLRSICFTALNHLRVRFTSLPQELQDVIGVEHAALLRVRIEGIFDEAGRVAQRECERYGAPWPPEPPPEAKAARKNLLNRGDKTPPRLYH